jgi:MSHA biogenesis protein MshJ
MRKYWHNLARRYDRLSTREQALVAGLCLVLVYILADTLLLAPSAVKQKRAVQDIVQKRQEVQTLSGQVTALEARRAQDPETIARRRLGALQSQLSEMQVDIRKQSALLIAAERMPTVIERLLANHPRVELVELKALPRVVIDLDPNAKKGDSPEQSARTAAGASGGKNADNLPRGIYRYGLEISIRGGYLDLLGYLRAIEAYPEKFFWERVDLTAAEYPVTTLKIKLYTLSLDSQWMRV